jgi:hypothetical protein
MTSNIQTSTEATRNLPAPTTAFDALLVAQAHIGDAYRAAKASGNRQWMQQLIETQNAIAQAIAVCP